MTATDIGDNKTKVDVTCKICKSTFLLTVPTTAFKSWRRGMLTQDAFPELNTGERELLISGVCGPCFDKMFPSEEDE